MSDFANGIQDIYNYALLREIALITREYEGGVQDETE